MKVVAAIVESANDFEQVTRSIIKEHIALQDDERNADAHERKSVGFREAAARRRVEIGRMLVEQKRSGKIKHGGWLPYLEKLGIGDQSARDWMRLAGHIEETKSQPSSNGLDLDRTPTRREVNEARKRDEQPDLPPHLEAESDQEPQSVFVPVFERVEKLIRKEAMSMFPGDRQLFAAWLRNVADEIDLTHG